MAKQVACDGCGKVARLELFDMVPAGWLTLSERNDEGREAVTLCSFECVGDYADKRLIAAGERSPVAPVVEAGWRPAKGGGAEVGHVAAAQADTSDE